MKYIFINIIKLILHPFTKPTISNIKFKDIIFENPLEHLLRTVSIIKKNTSDKSKNGVIIDVGAANGGTCLFFNNSFPENNIIGFEPVSETYYKALEQCKNYPNIEVRKLALSKMKGEAEISVTDNFYSSSILSINQEIVKKYPEKHRKKFDVLNREIIETSTLDNETRNVEHILLIKLDTQGTELQILSKGIEALKKTSYVLVEMNNHRLYDNACQYFEIDSFLRENYFKLADIVVTYRENGKVIEYDALYEKNK